MSDDGHRGIIDRYLRAIAAHNNEAMRPLMRPDAIFDWPQSRERIRGVANIEEIDAHMPGGLPEIVARRVVGAEDHWVMDPTFTPRRIAGSGDIWVGEADFTYPDGSEWAYCGVIELRGDLIARVTEYWAPRREAPEWRAQWVEPMPEGA